MSARHPGHTCRECGAAFPHKHSGRTKHWFCSRKCARRALAKRQVAARIAKPPERPPYRRERVCSHCRAGFVIVDARRAGQRACSTACATARNRASARRHYDAHGRTPQAIITCRECRSVFQTSHGGQTTFCSRRCARRWGGRVSGRNHIERARRRGLPRERFDPVEIFERDSWRCQLCHRSTPQRLRGSCDERAPELDHIVPIALGGAHTRANTQCACRRCNINKGARPFGQLRLVGMTAQAPRGAKVADRPPPQTALEVRAPERGFQSSLVPTESAFEFKGINP
jgi:5-methylcytosine-specific restriction endonuclease McrA